MVTMTLSISHSYSAICILHQKRCNGADLPCFQVITRLMKQGNKTPAFRVHWDRQMLPLHPEEERTVNLKCAGLRMALSAVLLAAVTAFAQAPPKADSSPVPQAIRDAKKIFVSNAGADSGLFPEPFSGDPSRGYTQFYTAL